MVEGCGSGQGAQPPSYLICHGSCSAVAEERKGFQLLPGVGEKREDIRVQGNCSHCTGRDTDAKVYSGSEVPCPQPAAVTCPVILGQIQFSSILDLNRGLNTNTPAPLSETLLARGHLQTLSFPSCRLSRGEHYYPCVPMQRPKWSSLGSQQTPAHSSQLVGSTWM